MNLPRAQVTGIQFGFLNPDEFRKLAIEDVYKPGLNHKGLNSLHSVNSIAFGSHDKRSISYCCGLENCQCDGTWGVLNFAYPMYNINFLDIVVKTLNCVCAWCSRCLFDETDPRFEDFIKENKNSKNRLLDIYDMCDKWIYCAPHHKQKRKSAKEHLLLLSSSSSFSSSSSLSSFSSESIENVPEDKCNDNNKYCYGVQFSYMRKNNDIWRIVKDSTLDGAFVKDKKYKISQAMVFDILSRIDLQSMELLGFSMEYTRPQDMMFEVFPIPPLTNRPSNSFKNNHKSKHKGDNIYTKKLNDLVALNHELKQQRCKIIRALRSSASSSSLSQSQEQECYVDDNNNNNEETYQKNKTTLTAVLRSNKLEKKNESLLLNEDRKQIVLSSNGELKIGASFRSGDPTINDQEWNDFLTNDIYFYQSCHELILELQYYVTSYIKEDTGNKKPLLKKPFLRPINNKQSLNSQIKGKTGLMRGNLCSKKVECCSRSVIISDSTLDVNQLGVPIATAMIVTFPERITPYNIDFLKRLVRNGPLHYPGANKISKYNFDSEEKDQRQQGRSKKDNNKSETIDLKTIDRFHYAEHELELKMGWFVYRHLQAGDFIGFNRQPSLHKFSFMGHSIKIIPGSCFTLHPAVCKCYNADFDGDAMIAHIVQLLTAFNEVRLMLNVSQLFLTAQSSVPIITPIQDTVLQIYLLTQDEFIVTHQKFISYLGKALYIPIARLGQSCPAFFAVCSSVHNNEWISYRNGKQLFSALLPPYDFDYCKHHDRLIRSTSSSPSSSFIFSTRSLQEELDDYYLKPVTEELVFISNSQLQQGCINSKELNGSNGIIHTILHLYGNETCRRFQSDLCRVGNEWFADSGFSVGSNDCLLKDHDLIQYLIHEGTKLILQHPLIGDQATFKKIDLLPSTHLVIQPYRSCTKETLDVLDIYTMEQFKLLNLKENVLLDVLNQFGTFIGNETQKQVKRWNRLWQMVDSGAKGKSHNLTQMFSCLGQTEVNNKRLTYSYRPSSHFLIEEYHDGILTFKHPQEIYDPHFKTHSLFPYPQNLEEILPFDSLMAHGFIKNSFTSGLNPIEFVNHAQGGRQGLIQSSTNTSESGYLGRKLMQSMSSLVLQNDLSVRDSAGNIIQLLYGFDGFDASYLWKCDFPFIQMNNQEIEATYSCIPYVESFFRDLETNDDQSATNPSDFLHRLFTIEIQNLIAYRDKLRKIRLHYPTSNISIRITSPVNIKGIILKGMHYQNQHRTNDQLILNASMIMRMIRSCLERCYSYYPSVFYRLWDFEALYFTELSCRKVLQIYHLNYDGLNWILAEIESSFRRSLAHPQQSVGSESSQYLSEISTQNMLNSHRVAGSNEAAKANGKIAVGNASNNLTLKNASSTDVISSGVFQDCINLTQKPKNPQMRLYTISMSELSQFMTDSEILDTIMSPYLSPEEQKKYSKLDDIDPLLQQHYFALFVSQQLIYYNLSTICLSSPDLVTHNNNNINNHDDVDNVWLTDSLSLYSFSEVDYLNKQCVFFALRFVIDIVKLQELQLDIIDVMKNIKKLLKESNELDTWTKRTEPPSSTSQKVKVPKGECIFFFSPLLQLSFCEDLRLYRVLRIYIPKDAYIYEKYMTNHHYNEYHALYDLMSFINTNCYISGVIDINNASVEQEKTLSIDPQTGNFVDQYESIILTNGSNIMDTLSLPFIDHRRSYSSCLIETYEVWGIIVGANRLSRALKNVLESNNSYVDPRHIMMVVKTMCHRGFYVPFRREGLKKCDDLSVIQKASFEECLSTISNAAVSAAFDPLLGQKENQLLGNLVPIGTGAVKIHLPSSDDVETHSFLQVTPLLLEKHREMIRTQHLPLLQKIDLDVMLFNSGEEYVYGKDLHLPPAFLSCNQKDNNESFIKLFHYQTRNEIRRTTLGSSTLLQIKDDNDQQQHQPSSTPWTITEYSEFWNTIGSKREHAQLKFKERLAKEVAYGDHSNSAFRKERKNSKSKKVIVPVKQTSSLANGQVIEWEIETVSQLSFFFHRCKSVSSVMSVPVFSVGL